MKRTLPLVLLGLVHRDLLPHNLRCGFDRRVKALDFGVAKMRDQRTMTLPGLMKGCRPSSAHRPSRLLG